MMFSSVKILTLGLIAGVAASPIDLAKRGKNIIIGYRTVSPEQAANYNKAGTVTDDGNRIGTQIGNGAYTTPGRGEFPGAPNAWYCVILADEDAVDRVSKAWVPKSFGGVELWFKNSAVDEYIKKLDSSWDPAKTLRMSRIDGNEDVLQMVIPPGLLNSNGGGMGITASCKQKLAEIPDVRVNYDDWKNNIKGSKDVIKFDDTPIPPMVIFPPGIVVPPPTINP